METTFRFLRLRPALATTGLLALLVALGNFQLRAQLLGPVEVGPRIPEWVGHTALTAANGAVTTMNLVRMHGEDRQSANAGFGLVTGVLQLGVGAIYLKDREGSAMWRGAYATAGVAAIATSAMRLSGVKLGAGRDAQLRVSTTSSGLRVTLIF